MRILLVSPKYNHPRGFEEYPSGALVSLGTIARRLGHEVRCLHLEMGDDLMRELFAFAPDIVGITATTVQVKSAKEVAQQAKWWSEWASRKVTVIAGGAHLSAVGREFFISCPGVDAICLGEGETAWTDILEGKPLGETTNIFTREGGSNGYMASNLDEISNLPDLALFDLGQFCGAIPLGPKPSFFIMGSRGCPFECIFCQNAWGKKVRYRSPERVMTEIKYLKAQGIKEIFFQDDNFNLNHDWAKEILSGIIACGLNDIAYRLVFRCNEELVSSELLHLAREAGVWIIFYGVESLSQRMPDSMKKGLSVAEIERAVRLTKETGIRVQASFIIGLPGESRQTVRETVEALKKLSPDVYGYIPALPLPGTELRRLVKDQGHLVAEDYEDYMLGQIVLDTDDLSTDDIREALRSF